MKGALKVKQKAFFIILKGFQLPKSEKAPLTLCIFKVCILLCIFNDAIKEIE